ncbi:uncharacterized protein LOC107639987 [Arachis ipaensis]|uniref:uncharacterized protein LOC107639987 n=1 Tax=Arachis ipaensis TaxID=130454 RepID=UPI0007AFD810|nr:uncharacterized protein LOC107639987 [Arachis ipaensis]
MECVSTTSMSVLINGLPIKPFKMERDLRQGDPLSPFLFVLVVDVLHRMIGVAVRNGRIAPLLVGRDNIELSHLQFADDTVLFCPPEEETIKNYKRLLRSFEVMLGLSINFDKSNLIPVNCEQQWVQSMCSLLGVQRGYSPGQRGPVEGYLSVTDQGATYKRQDDKWLVYGYWQWQETLFWEDVWLSGGPLKERFPRLFSVSDQKESVIGNYGFWDGLEWIWNFQWRRELFQWELELVNQLHDALRPIKLAFDREDRVVWKFDKQGIFSTNSFVQVLQVETLLEEITSYSFTKTI